MFILTHSSFTAANLPALNDPTFSTTDLQVVLWHHNGAAAGYISAGVLAVTVRVSSLSQVLIGSTLSEKDSRSKSQSGSEPGSKPRLRSSL